RHRGGAGGVSRLAARDRSGARARHALRGGRRAGAPPGRAGALSLLREQRQGPPRSSSDRGLGRLDGGEPAPVEPPPGGPPGGGDGARRRSPGDGHGARPGPGDGAGAARDARGPTGVRGDPALAAVALVLVAVLALVVFLLLGAVVELLR